MTGDLFVHFRDYLLEMSYRVRVLFFEFFKIAKRLIVLAFDFFVIGSRYPCDIDKYFLTVKVGCAFHFHYTSCHYWLL